MEQNTEFVNLYLSKILAEVSELTKAKLILATQVAWHERTIQEMTETQARLQEANTNLTNKLKTATERKPKTKNSAEHAVQDAETF